MKVEKIMNMDVEEMVKDLTEEMVEDIRRAYVTLNNALHTYQEGAELSNQEEYLTPEDYFTATLDQE